MQTPSPPPAHPPVAVVIGGGNGIGAATCRVMTERGWKVAVADLDEPGARLVAEALGTRSFFADVTDQATLDALSHAVETALGAPAALVVSSGSFQASRPIEHDDHAAWRRLIDVNLEGCYRANRTFGMGMAARGQGSIVNIASVTGMLATPLNAYGPSKAAIINLTQSLAGEWGRSGVRVNSVSPGVTLVPRVMQRLAQGARYAADPADITALGRCVEPVEVAEAVEFLSSARAAAITGVNLPVDCGWLVGTGWALYGGSRAARAGDDHEPPAPRLKP
jgi:NAD(P)-dependent dehydrogenase (short-subunit alcohol dehydrogenase family)